MGPIREGRVMPVCELSNRMTELVQLFAEAMDWTIVPQGAWDYALLVEATSTPLDRAIAYLRDCGREPEQAKGRLLLRAAERALRRAGEIGQ